MKNLDVLAIFARVAEMRSFTQAAESLGIQKGRVSTVVRDQEKEVGATLLCRTTRTVQLTEEGRLFYSRARDLLSETEELQSMFRDVSTPLRGRLRVDMPAVLAQSVVIPALPALLDAHPELQLELSSSDRYVDLVQEGIDCVVRLGPILDETLIARPLGHLRIINAASPAYLQRFGVPASLDELVTQGHRMVHYTRNFGSRHEGWQYPAADGFHSLMLPGAIVVNSVPAYHDAGLAGLGLIQGGYSSLLPYIKRGELVEILPHLRPQPLTASFVVAHRRSLSKRVRAFMDWMEETLRTYFD
ncbi:LysR substrate-binding domain-containing protein [Pantoea sp.]|uniref:LysR substrate-binding domain-containing protein n=1 Tax=Pantoea sp. TaxID=69393 RepID=UPI0028AB208B|nr:LysR substrate-binding domain-containing protein [Pantoea sp.]